MSVDIAAVVKKLLSPIARRVGLMIVRGTVSSVDDSKSLQTMQVSLLADQVRDIVERFQQYGFTSVPNKDAEVIVLHIGGDGDHSIVVAVDDRSSRPTGLSAGESCMYTSQNGKRVYAKSDGKVELGTSPTDFAGLASKIDSAVSTIVTAFNTHTHSGVTTGPGSSGVPVAIITPAPDSVAASEVKIK